MLHDVAKAVTAPPSTSTPARLLQATAAAVLFIAGPALAQVEPESVQWRVEDGGNGHWYRFVDHPAVPGGVVFSQLDDEAASLGGHLVSITTSGEWDFVRSLDSSATGFWTGLRSSRCQSWHWTTGEPVSFTAWGSANCGAGPYPNNCSSTDLGMFANDRDFDCGWNWDDFPQGLIDRGEYVLEWPADGNGDGIVDYGQILDGTFDDLDRNGVPDCCDGGSFCRPPCPADLSGECHFEMKATDGAGNETETGFHVEVE